MGHDDLVKLGSRLVGAVLLVGSLVGCSDGEPQAGDFCGGAEAVRTANLRFAEELSGPEPWDEMRSAIGETVKELRDALDALPGSGNNADDVQLWMADLDILSARVTESQSVEDFLYEPDSSRPAPDDLNPALDRIDATFEAECGFAARP